MKGMLIRDSLLLYKRYLRVQIITISTLGLILTLIMGAPMSNLLSIAVPLGMGALMVNIFAEDEKDNWLKEAKTMPVSSIHVVLSRYIVFTMVILVCSAYFLCMNLLAYFIYGEQKLAIYLVTSALGFGFAVMNNLLMLPTCYKFGVQGANVVALGVLFSVGILTFALKKISFDKLISAVQSIPVYSIYLIIAVVFAVAGALSIVLSVRIYDKDEIV